MTNKCPMCNTDESERTEVLRVLKPFADWTETLVNHTPEAPRPTPQAYKDILALYRKLKTQ